jgi:7-cyano-7-deazaguanine synthase in queuosine biosynthesis
MKSLRTLTLERALRVAVLEKGQRAPSAWDACWIGDHLSFTTARLESYCLASWKPLAFDALLLAAAVEYCDRILKRPALGWGRDFEVRLPVHELAHWTSAPVSQSLHDALNFLTGDRWRFHFVARKKAEVAPSQGHFDLPRGVASILPFSDGMDSRAVAGIEGRKLGDRLIRVRLGAKIVDRPAHNGPKQPFTTVPYRVRTDQRNEESSARSRGFKFAAVSGVAAYLVGADEIIVPESAQGALGPALVPVGHGYEDLRNHPLFTDRMASFLGALFGRTITFRFPRLWSTKGQTLAEYARTAGIDACLNARSCWQQSRQVGFDEHRRQCGICAACLLRRLSVHAAGFTEDRETYLWENLSAPTFERGAARGFHKITPALREYAIAGILHLHHLAALRTSPVHAPALKRHAYQLARSQGLVATEAESRLDAFFLAHAQEWHAFLRNLGPDSFVSKWTSSTYERAA